MIRGGHLSFFSVSLLALALAGCDLTRLDEDGHSDPGCTKGRSVDQSFEGELAITSDDDVRYRGEDVKLRPDTRFAVHMGFADLVIRRPEGVGAQPLDAEVCSANWDGCTKVEGTIEVRVTEPRALEARIIVEEATFVHAEYFIEGEGRVHYAENEWTYCWESGS